jgi:hypothetical protein
MALDYGARRKPRRGVVIISGAVLALVAMGALLLVVVHDRQTKISEANGWTVGGAPCARAAGVAWDMSDAPPQIVDFGKVRFARAHGATRCAEIGYAGGRSDDVFPVCQFDHPGRLEITTDHGATLFELGPQDPATVSVEHGVARCVVGRSQDVD